MSNVKHVTAKGTEFVLKVTAKGHVGIQVPVLNGKRIIPMWMYVQQAEAVLSEDFQVGLGKFIDDNAGVLTKQVSKEDKMIAQLEAKLAEAKAKKQAA